MFKGKVHLVWLLGSPLSAFALDLPQPNWDNGIGKENNASSTYSTQMGYITGLDTRLNKVDGEWTYNPTGVESESNTMSDIVTNLGTLVTAAQNAASNAQNAASNAQTTADTANTSISNLNQTYATHDQVDDAIVDATKTMCDDMGGSWRTAETKTFTDVKILSANNLIGFKAGGHENKPYIRYDYYYERWNSKNSIQGRSYRKVYGQLGALTANTSAGSSFPGLPSGYSQVHHDDGSRYQDDDGGGYRSNWSVDWYTPSVAWALHQIAPGDIIYYATGGTDSLYGWHAFSSPNGYYPRNSKGVPDFISNGHMIPNKGASVVSELHNVKFKQPGQLELNSHFAVSIPAHCSM